MDPQNYVIYFSISDVIGQTVEVLNKASFYLRYVYWSDQFEILELLISGDDEKSLTGARHSCHYPPASGPPISFQTPVLQKKFKFSIMCSIIIKMHNQILGSPQL